MNIKEAKKIIVSLSKPEKMPGFRLWYTGSGMQNRQQAATNPEQRLQRLLRIKK